MRYVAHVMMAFLDHAKGQTVFEVWESTLVFGGGKSWSGSSAGVVRLANDVRRP